ncbi:MAG: hypothetical protein EZS28_023600 [Streblomastix strix]|uniref:Tc1-like transposase DDE domain-containing protein n=1 Tax=Streblomastix strix TaxID=222440 RepID=A0A5J4VEL1_9EUKA|nr:MAG: hypothetical protein EZS28_023600 [Streblomastix strix]
MDQPYECNLARVDVNREAREDVLSIDYQRYEGAIVRLGISQQGVLRLEIVNDYVKSDTYNDLITSEAIASIHKHHDSKFSLLQDNATAHERKNNWKAFNELSIKVMKWPVCSPDLSPIENLFNLIGQRVYATTLAFETEDLRWNSTKKDNWSTDTKKVESYAQIIDERMVACDENQYNYFCKLQYNLMKKMG